MGGLILAALGVLTALPGCRPRQEPPPPPVIATPEQPLAPWAWHKLGGLLVVEGEVDGPMDLVLKGRYLNERMHAEFGPVRWELYAPPPGEIAELRTKEGKLLAHWDFDAPVPKPPEAPEPVKIATPVPVAKKAIPPPPPPPAPIKPVVSIKPVIPVPPPKTPSPTRLAKATPALPNPHPPAVPLRPLAKVPLAPAPPIQPEPLPKALLPASPAKNLPGGREAFWPETHLPLVHGPAAKRVQAPKPSPVPAKAPPAPHAPALAAAPPPAAPRARVSVTPPPPIRFEPLPSSLLPPGLAKEWPGAGEAFNLIRGPRGSHWTCMTFDGGSTSEVALEVLDALKERGIRTTFFLTGAFIQKYPDLVRRIDRDGHEIGNHTMDHPHLAPGGRRDPRWTKERFQQQLLLADALLLKLLGRPMDPYWRAPYGENTAELRKWAEELGYRHVYWSEGADTLDWATVKERKLYRTGNAILDRLYSRMEKDDGDGLIVLMHLGSGRPEADRPARVLGPFLDKALEEGWNFVNISAYLKESGKPRWNSSNRLAMLGQTALRQ